MTVTVAFNNSSGAVSLACCLFTRQATLEFVFTLKVAVKLD